MRRKTEAMSAVRAGGASSLDVAGLAPCWGWHQRRLADEHVATAVRQLGSFVAWHGELGTHSAPLASPEKELSRLRKIRFRTR